MNDPHVESLRYRLNVDETFGQFRNPPALHHETSSFRLELADGLLSVQMKEHHPTVDSARQQVEPLLEAWELDSALTREHSWLKFVFDPGGTRIVDRNPPPLPAGHVQGVGACMVGRATASATGTVTPPEFPAYPKPPADFASSPEIQVMVSRYERAIWGDEFRLLAESYAILTLLEKSIGTKPLSRAELGKFLRADIPVLSKLSELASIRGNLNEARKFDHKVPPTPLTSQENAWLRAALKKLIRRRGEIEHAPQSASSLPQITMNDLPPL